MTGGVDGGGVVDGYRLPSGDACTIRARACKVQEVALPLNAYIYTQICSLCSIGAVSSERRKVLLQNLMLTGLGPG